VELGRIGRLHIAKIDRLTAVSGGGAAQLHGLRHVDCGAG
jgi:hypothetical protein